MKTQILTSAVISITLVTIITSAVVRSLGICTNCISMTSIGFLFTFIYIYNKETSDIDLTVHYSNLFYILIQLHCKCLPFFMSLCKKLWKYFFPLQAVAQHQTNLLCVSFSTCFVSSLAWYHWLYVVWYFLSVKLKQPSSDPDDVHS